MSIDRKVFVGIGSNLDDPLKQARRALSALHALPSSTFVRVSGFYRTPPWGVAEQPPFINAVAELRSSLSAPEVLNQLIAIERTAGRVREGARWGPRVLDLDLLLYDDAVIDLAGLQVPHPRLHERAFVLLPLAELAPEVIVPGRGKAADLLARVNLAGCERLHDGML